MTGGGAAVAEAAGGYGPPGGGYPPGGPPPGPPPGGGPPGYGPPGGGGPPGYGGPPPGSPPGFGGPPQGGPPPYAPGPGGGFAPPAGGYGGGVPGQGPKVHPLAILSLVLGILSIPLCCCSLFGAWAPVGAVACGLIAMNKIKLAPHLFSGNSLAIAGIVTGSFGLMLDLIAIFTTIDENLKSQYGHF